MSLLTRSYGLNMKDFDVFLVHSVASYLDQVFFVQIFKALVTEIGSQNVLKFLGYKAFFWLPKQVRKMSIYNFSLSFYNSPYIPIILPMYK